MNRDDIIKMAREAGIGVKDDSLVPVWHLSIKHLERFAALVAAAERNTILQMSNEQWFKTQADFESAIRARGQEWYGWKRKCEDFVKEESHDI